MIFFQDVSITTNADNSVDLSVIKSKLRINTVVEPTDMKLCYTYIP